jgi:tRNA (guanine37-N1)-methyltransferase
MLEIVVLTLFPEMFSGVLGESILKRALEQGVAKVDLVNFRDFADDKHKTVDDYPFGGGAGMLLKPAPIFRAVEHVRQSSAVPEGDRVVLLSPQGRTFTQRMAEEFSKEKRLIFICGHYEGFDDRIRQHLVTDEVSLGDFVLTGGEIAAMAIMDAVIRLLPSAVGNHESVIEDSFSSGLLEYPQFTRPADFNGLRVPDTLLSGNHKLIAEWRRRHALYRTWRRRPDLLETVELTEQDKADLAKFNAGDFSGIDVLT